MSDLWKTARTALTQPTSSNRTIGRRPVLNLSVLQAMVTNGELTEDEVWAATDSCERDLENEQWSYEDVLHLLCCLEASDFRKAEWCQVKGGEMYPCDVYRLHFDFERGVRNARGLEVYVKFSVSEDNQLTLVLVSCHGSR